jgi:leader peptidase (prepilin peptidase) / N-methyltransferase
MLSVLVVVATITDLRSRRIPNLLTGGGFIAGICWFLLFDPDGLLERVVVCVAVALPLGLLSLTRPDAFGMGDVKLIAVLALLIGWPVLPVVLVPAMAGAASFGFALAALRRAAPGPTTVPLAPFLAAPALVWAVFALPA